MKRLITLFAFIFLWAMYSTGQIYLTESFEGAWSGTPPVPSDWSNIHTTATGGTSGTDPMYWAKNTWSGSAWSPAGHGTPTTPTGAYDGSSVAWFDDYNAKATQKDQLCTGDIDLSTSTSPRVSFYLALNASSSVTLKVRGSDDGGSTWNDIQTITKPGVAWTKISVAIPALYKVSNARIGFEVTATWGSYDVWLDKVVIEEAPQPLTGIKTIDPVTGDYTTFAAAIAALNDAGVGSGGVTFNVTDGTTYTETPLAINVTGTSSDPITFQQSGSGTKPIINFTGSSSTSDYGFRLNGSDYITFNGLEVRDAGTASASYIEYGFHFLGASTNGCQNNTVKNCVVDLTKSNTSSRCIYLNSVASGTAGANSNNKFYNNTVHDAYNGYYFLGSSTSYDDGNEVNIQDDGNSLVDNLGNATTSTLYAVSIYYQTNMTFANTVISNITGAYNIYGIYSSGSSNTVNCYGNELFNFTCSSASSSYAPYGFYNSSGTLLNFYSNLIYTITSSYNAFGMYIASGTANNIYKNSIFDINYSGSSTYVAHGIAVFGGTTNNIFNNFIYDIRAAAATSSTTNPNVRALNLSGGTTNNVFFNTVYLNYTASGSTNQSAALYMTATPATVDLRNNIFVNNTNVSTTGTRAVAHYRTSATYTNFSTNSDNNLYYCGNPGAKNLIFYDGTNPDQTLSEYKTRMATRDQNAVTENPPFISVTPPYDLHISETIPTQIESGGIPVTSPIAVNIDFDGNTRDENYPDIGADEFDGIQMVLCDGTPESSTITGPGAVCYNTGTNLELSVLYTDLGITYQWKSSETQGGPYSDLGTASGQYTGNLTATTYYICIITCTNSSLFFTTPEKTVSVNALPTVQVSPTSGDYCTPDGTPVQLTASGATTYSWSPADGLDATTGAVVNASPSVTTIYTVTGTDDNGCQNTANVTITVGKYPVISSVTATPDAICPGGTSQLNVSANIPTQVKAYSFQAGTGTSLDPMTGATTVIGSSVDDNPTATPANIGFTFKFNEIDYTQYSVSPDGWLLLGSATATNQYTNSVTSTSNIPKIYPYWDDMATGTTGNVKTLVTGTAPNRIFIVQWFVTIPRSTSSAANSTCQAWLYEDGGKIEFRYGTMGTPTSGSISSGLTGGSANFNCITFSSNTASSTTANDANAIAPASGTIYTFTPLQPTYQWSPADGLTPGANVANPLTPALYSTTEYTVTVFNGGCSTQQTVTVSLADPLNASVNDPLRCSADVTVPITGSQTGGAPSFTYTWTPTDDLFEDAAGTIIYDGSALDSPTIYTATGTSGFTYLLTVTDNCGTTATAASTVTVNPTPTASAASNEPVCTGETLELYGTTDIGTSFSWTGPNGFTSDQQNPVIPDVTLAANGTYYFTATAGGCPSAEAEVQVVINPTPSELFITPSNALICPGSVQQLVISGGTISNVGILSEDFEGEVSGWTTQNNSTGGTPDDAAWTLYISGGSVASNDNSIFALSNSDAQGYGGTTDTKLFTPVMNTTGFASLTLSFWHNFRWYSSADIAQIEVSLDGGSTWLPAPLVQYSGGSVGTPTSWVNAIIDMTDYIDQTNLMLCFHYQASWGYWWGLDNVVISGDKTMEITWSPFDNLYLDEDATQAYNGEVTNTVYAEIYTTETYTATATSEAGCTSTGTATVTGVTYEISGTLKYNNTAQTPMNLVELTLNPGGYTAMTDGDGEFSFFDICAGDYTIEVTDINKPVGGINSSDAVQMNVWNANQPPIQHAKFLAGETNLDMNISVTATDALAVQNFFVFGTPFDKTSVTGSPWVFWKAGELVLGNNDPNRLLTDIPVSVVASDVIVDLYGQAIGDFSGSFVPGNLKGGNISVEMLLNDTRMAGAGVTLDLPVRILKASSVSAISLIMNFPADLVQITGISMADETLQPAWSVNSNELRIGWNSTQPLWFAANDRLLTIHLATSQDFGQGESIRFALAADPLNELADGNFEVIPDAILGMDAVEFSAYGIGEPADGSSISMKIRPNPFNDYTMLNFTIPSYGYVTLRITDMLGREVALLVDESKDCGNYSVKLDAVPLQAGVYTATIRLQTADGDMVRSIKLIRN